MPIVSFIAFFLVFLFSVNIFANDDVHEVKFKKDYFFHGTDSDMIKTIVPFLDTTHNWLSHQVEDTGQLIDGIFNTEDSFDERNGSRLDIVFPINFNDHGYVSSSVNFRSKVELPNLNKRWNLIVSASGDKLGEIFDEGGASEGSSSQKSSTTSSANSTEIGLQFKIKSENYSLSFLDAGINLQGLDMPDYFVRIKGHYQWQLSEKITAKMNQNLFYRGQDGVGLRSRQVFDYKIDKRQLLRSQTVGTWWDSEQYYDLQHDFLYYEIINNHRSFAYNLSWNWDNLDNEFELNKISIGFDWREKIYKNWLFFSIKPNIGFLKKESFEKNYPSITFELEARFFKL